MHPAINVPRVNRILPPHELNARRARKRVLNPIPAAQKPAAPAAALPATTTLPPKHPIESSPPL